MSDYDKIKDDDEYQFPQDEYVGGTDDYQAHQDDQDDQDDQDKPQQDATGDLESDEFSEDNASFKASSMHWLKQKFAEHQRAIIIGGIAVAVLVIFAVIKPSHKASSQPAPTATTSPSQSSIDRQLSSVTSQVNSTINSTIADVRRTASTNQQTLTQLQTKVNRLQGSVSQIQATQTQLTSNLAQLQSQIAELVKVAKAAQQEQQPAQTTKTDASASYGPHKVYHLRAAIPGRAWIVESDGTSLSITVGDKVQSYGKVTSIDPEQNIVSTSSGRTIEEARQASSLDD